MRFTFGAALAALAFILVSGWNESALALKVVLMIGIVVVGFAITKTQPPQL